MKRKGKWVSIFAREAPFCDHFVRRHYVFLGVKFGGVWVNVVNLYSTIIFEEEVMNFTK